MTTSHIPTSVDVSIWRRNAKKLVKKEKISLTKALEVIAKEKGFSSWKHLTSTSQQSNSILNDPEVGSFLKSLPIETQLAAEKGDYHVRKSYVSTQNSSPKEAKQEIIRHFKRIIKDSKRHIEIRIWFQVPSALITNLDGNEDKFFCSIKDLFPRINEVLIDYTDKRRRWGDFKNDSSDPLYQFLHEEE